MVDGESLLPNQKRRYLNLTIYIPPYLQPEESNQVCLPAGGRLQEDYRRKNMCFSRLPEPGQVAAGAFIGSIAYNVLRAVQRFGHGAGPPRPDDPHDNPGYSIRTTREGGRSASTGIAFQCARYVSGHNKQRLRLLPHQRLVYSIGSLAGH